MKENKVVSWSWRNLPPTWQLVKHSWSYQLLRQFCYSKHTQNTKKINWLNTNRSNTVLSGYCYQIFTHRLNWAEFCVSSQRRYISSFLYHMPSNIWAIIYSINYYILWSKEYNAKDHTEDSFLKMWYVLYLSKCSNISHKLWN